MSKPILIVGAGFSGATVARVLAEAGYQIVVIEKRSHIAGNAYDYVNEFGIRVHAYGPHLFHTNNHKVVEWLSKFTQWLPYKHRVKAMLNDGRLVTLPVNNETAAIVGKENIVDTFIRPYTEKMWDLTIEELDPEILNRVSIRDDNNEYYFPNDSFQALPSSGYTTLIKNMLDHENITVNLNTPFSKNLESHFIHCFNSMPIDEYFDYSIGELPYRSIKFHSLTLPLPKLFDVSVVNFTHNSPYTRITEWKNLPGHGNTPLWTTITYEEPCDFKDNNFERFYPIKDSEGLNRETYENYLSKVTPNVTFIGRCGMYAYIDMHQAISSAHSIASRYIKHNQI